MEIHLDRVGNRIWMGCRWRGDFPDRSKKIPGSDFISGARAVKWSAEIQNIKHPPKGCWSFPLNWRTCLDLRKEFGTDCKIIIHPELDKWARRERQRRMDLMAIRAMDEFPTPVLARVYPRLNEAIHHRAFQSVGVGFAVRAGVSVNGDHPGLGKTLQAIGAAVESEAVGPLLVVAPAVAATVTWPDEMRDWAPDEQFVVAEGSREQREATIERFRRWAASRPTRRSWLFINIEMLQADRPPAKKRKGKKATWKDWLGLDLAEEAVKQGMDDADALEEHLELGFIEVRRYDDDPNLVGPFVEPAKGSPAWLAIEEYQAALEAYDPTERRHQGLFEEVWSAIFIDESHKILPAKSSLAKKQSQIRSGAQKLRVKPGTGVKKMGLSGTPWRGNPLNQWGALHWLDPIQYSSYWDYADRWFDVVDTDDGNGKIVEGIRPGVERAFGEDMDVTMIRRTMSEAAPWLPAKVYAGTRLDADDDKSPIGVWLDMGPKQQKAYDEMTRDAVARLTSGQLQAIGVLAEMTRQKQFACSLGDVTRVLRKVPDRDLREWADTFRPALPSNKWEWILEFLDERGIVGGKGEWGEGKIVIGSWQTGLLNIFRDQLGKLKIPSLTITGETRNADRGEAKRRFQMEGGPRVFLLNTFAGGVSLTLDRADDMIIVDETWVPDDQEQLEHRIHRLSRGAVRGPATYWYLRSRGTIDAHIAMMTENKDRIQKELLDGRRGVDYAKKLLTGGQ